MTDCPDCPHAVHAHYVDGCMLCTCTQSEDALRARGLKVGQALRDEGITRVLGPDAAAEWRDRAYQWITSLASGERLTSIDLVDAVGEPPSVNAVGAVMRSAGTADLIHKTGGYMQSSRPKRHAAIIAIWQRN